MRTQTRFEPRHSIRPWALALGAFMAVMAVMMTFAPDADAQRKRKRKKRAPQQNRTAPYLKLAFGVPGACLEGTDFCPDGASDATFALAPDIALGLRLSIISIEARGFFNPFEVDGRDASFGGGFLSLKLHPLSRGEFDLYLGAGVGGLTACRDLGGGRELNVEGAAAHLGAGVDFYLSRNISLGIGFDRYFLFPNAEDEQDDAASETEGFWTGRLNLTIYFDVQTTTSKRKKRRPRKKPRPKKPRKPRKPTF